MKRKLLTVLWLCLVGVIYQAQGQINGPSPANIGPTSQTYSYSSGGIIMSPTWRLGGDTQYGNITSQWQSGSTYYASIVWTTVGNETLTFMDGYTQQLAQKNITIIEAPPAAPIANAATGVGTSFFTANWSTVGGASGYRLDVSTSSNFSSLLSGYNNLYISGTSLGINGLTGNTTYYYRVRALSQSGAASVNSNVVTVTTAPSAPVALSATTIIDNSFTARWQSVSGAIGYRIDVSSEEDFSPLVNNLGDVAVGNVTSYTLPGYLTALTTYYYRVRAVSAAGASGNSNTIIVTTIQPPPGVLNATGVTSSSFTAAWSSVGGASGYRLDVSASSSFSSFVTGYNNAAYATTTASVIGLSPGTTYYYRVRAEQTGMNGWTTGSSSVMTALTAPASPLIYASAVTNTSFTSVWTAVNGATNYRMDVSLSNDFSSFITGYNNVTVSGTSAAVSGLTPNTTYYARMRSVNASGTSENSNVITVLTIPAAPVATAASSITAVTFNANWNAISGMPYRLDVSTASNFSSFTSYYNNIPVNGGSLLITGLSGNTTYYYRLRTSNSTATSGNSNVMSALTLPAAPVANAATNITSTSFMANWSAVSNITTYQLDVSTDITFNSIVTGYNGLAVSGTSRAVTGLAGNKNYYYRVRSVNATGNSVDSNVQMGPNLDRNYVRTVQVVRAGITTQSQFNSAVSLSDRLVSYDYFDGLGRPAQKVQAQSSPGQFDIVQPIAYDEYGREKFKYLPYVTTETNGMYKPNPVGTSAYAGSPHQQYYNNGLTDKVADDSKPFSETVFIPSPLNQVLEQGSPGAAWQPDGTHAYTSTDRTAKFAYELNTANEVLRWKYTYPTATYPLGLVNTGTGSTPLYYAVNELLRTKTRDEHASEVIEFKDKDGKVVLKKVQAPGGQWAQTYYLYDDFGNLVCVLPPEAVVRLGTEYYQADAIDATKDAFLKRWAFRYAYDAQKRMTQKQVPGAQPVYMVYDKRDRLVLTQDGEQRKLATKYWTFTKYDELNRPILTGIKDTTALTQEQMQAAVNTFYNKSWTKLYETYVGTVAGSVHGYSNKSYPVVTAGATLNANRYLTATYYDRYNFRSTWIGNFAYVNDALSQVVNGVTYTQPATEHPSVNGQPTGMKTKVLDGGVAGGFTWLKTITYYDNKNRVVQVQSENYKGGIDRVSNLYDFSGKILQTRTSHLESDVSWKDIVGAKQEGNKLVKTVTEAAWGASGAASVQELATGQNGWLEFTASETTTARMVGLSDQNTNANYTTIDFALYQLNTGALHVYENGTNRGQVGTYSPGDILKIERIGTSVKYYRNNALIFTSPTSSSSKLMADAAFHTLDATLVNVRTSFSTTSKNITRRFEYDHAGRLLRTWHKYDTQPEILLTHNTYNELGQLIDKKLHSTVATGSDAKQSVDYRYNIRGWMSSINNAELATNTTNDDTGDYFGMNLAYHEDLLTGNNTDLQYNGNISAAKWSVNQGYGTTKAMAYNFKYDAMNRLSSATHKKAETLGTWIAGQYDENGLLYDLNGNISALQRKGDNGLVIDNLTYNYGTGTNASNKLVYVQDNATDALGKPKGFIDGNTGTAIDYTYDDNGNMITDLNKGISSAITYNFLNLPEVVAKGGNNIRYIYDASGRKLSQVTAFGSTVKQSDYSGEFIYENDMLQFINHEEGRIVVSNERVVFADPGENTANKTASNATLSTFSANGEQYIRVTSSGAVARSGIYPIGGNFPVVAGERYRIKAKGYRAGANAVYLLIKANTTDLNWPGAALASSSATESWIEQTVTIPAGATTLQAGVVWNSVTAGEIFYFNEFVIEQLTAAAPEYQYHIKDHLGNVRVTFTTKDEIESGTATLETANATAEQAKFLRYQNVRRVQSSLFDRTNGAATGYSQRLNGSANEKYGLARSLSVMPGDKISMEVYAKYVDTNSANWTAALNTLLTQIANGTAPAGTVVDGGSYPASTSSFQFPGVLNTSGSTGTGPKAYLNYIIFDRNYVYKTGGFQRLSATPKETGSDVAHERLFFDNITIAEPGYIYIYLSNENETQVEVYFDDFKVTHTKSPVIAAQDYYPFGLAFNSYQRENSLKQKFKFQGQEHIDDLDLGWDSFKWRNHQPDIGRFFNVDPLAEKYYYNSPYAFSENKVVAHVELEGLEAVGIEAIDLVNAMTPPPAQPTGGGKVLNGVGNVMFGTVGAIGAGAYIIGTEGAGAALGGGTAIAFSLGEVAIGVAQIVDGISEMNGGNSDKTGTLEKSNSLPGLVANASGSKNAQMVDAVGQFIPGMLSGGNLKALKEGWSVIKSSQNAAEATQNVLSTVDAALDTKGVIDAALQFSMPGQSSTTGTPGVKADANKPDTAPDPDKQPGLY